MKDQKQSIKTPHQPRLDYSRQYSGPTYSRALSPTLLAVYSLIAITFYSVSMPVYSAEQQIYAASYTVDYDGIQLGVSQRSVSVSAEGIITSKHLLRPQGLAALFGEVEYTDTSQIYVKAEQAWPLTVQRDSGRSSESYAAKFLWQDGVIELSTGNLLEMSNHEVHDIESWLIDLMVAPTKFQEGHTISLLERADRFRTYRVAKVDMDRINVLGNSMEVLRVRLEELNNSSRAYTAWLAPDFHNMVVQLARHKKSNNLTFLLSGFEDLTTKP